MKFFDKGGLPPHEYHALRERLGGKPRVLAWAASRDGVVVGLPDRLMVRDAAGWHETPWHDILRGGWNDEGSALHWTTLSTGESHEVPLVAQGRIPELFRERVEATILLQKSIAVPPNRTVLVSARRSLVDPRQPVIWAAHPGAGVRLDDPDTRAFVDAEVARLKAEYAF